MDSTSRAVRTFPRARASSPTILHHGIATASLFVAMALNTACAAHRAPHAASEGGVDVPSRSGHEEPLDSSAQTPGASTTKADGSELRSAFAANARIHVGDQSRRFKMRCYTAAPDRLRMEIRGPVGGIVLVVTARDGRGRIVVPSKRRYAETLVQEDLGSALLGVPLTGCDLGLIVRTSTGASWFHPCGDQDRADPREAGPAQEETGDEGRAPAINAPSSNDAHHAGGSATMENPVLIERTSSVTGDRVLITVDRSSAGAGPSRVSILWGSMPLAQLTLEGFRALDFPKPLEEDFFWEPVPADFSRVSPSDLDVEESP